jgi:hypothetical protein
MRATPVGWLCEGTGPVGATNVCAVGAIPAPRLPSHPDFFGTAGLPYERRSFLAIVAARPIAGATQAWALACVPTHVTAAQHVWAYDFAFDGRASGQQLKCPIVIGEYTRECLVMIEPMQRNQTDRQHPQKCR